MFRARKRRRRKAALLGAIGILVFLVSAAVVGTRFVRRSMETPLDARNCPESGTIPLSAIILDATDQLNEVTRQDLEHRLVAYLQNEVAFGEAVQVWRVSSDAHAREPMTAVICRPAIPAETLDSNPRLAREDEETQYMRPVMAAIGRALSAPEDSSSPILETVQHVVLAGTTSGRQRTRLRRVVLASDLAQHTIVSLELGAIDFEKFRRSPEYVALNPGEMEGVGLLALHVQRRRHFGRVGGFETFWRSLIEAQHGSFSLEQLRGQSVP
jgi:hypothetical protein